MNWNDVLNAAKSPAAPDSRVEKTEADWKAQLTPEQFRVTRKHGTESAFSGEYCEAHSPGIYACICCGTELFDSTTKFDSRSGWPSFTEPVKDNVIRYKKDTSWGMTRIETLCNVCDAHLGHVFPDGPRPSGLRFCINSVALKKVKPRAKAGSGDVASSTDAPPAKEEPEPVGGLQTATVGGGCFWCIEALLDEIQGVESVTSGYAGGEKLNPTYREVCNGDTGHAEVVQVQFNPSVVSYADLLRIFLSVHNPTLLNRQGADAGSQYRSIILYHNEAQHKTTKEVIAELEPYFEKKIVTEVALFETFYKAEAHHQEYYKSNPAKAYCQSVIDPKLVHLRKHFSHVVKGSAQEA